MGLGTEINGMALAGQADSLLGTLSELQYVQFRSWLHSQTGISLGPGKKPLVAARLAKRLKNFNLTSYGDYFDLLMSGQRPEEVQVALDLLTTNETYFFREPKHFEVLTQIVRAGRVPGRPYRIWSAASSSGEEPYTLAMVLAETLGLHTPWEVFASDISSRVLETARRGTYSMERSAGIPVDLLRKYALRGIGESEGTFLIDRPLRERVRFASVNLNEDLPSLGDFDVVFLRNVLIYFEQSTKRAVVQRILARLVPGGYLFVSHSESLHGISEGLVALRPSVYRRN